MKNPNGSVQGLCSSAAALIALTFAFIGYMSFGSKSVAVPWQETDLIWLTPSALGVLFLISVPFLATTPRSTSDEEYKSIKWARVAYSIGAILVVFGIGASISIDFRNAKNLEQPGIDSPAKIK